MSLNTSTDTDTDTSSSAQAASPELDGLAQLADRVAAHLRDLPGSPEDAVVGIYRPFGRSSRQDASRLRVLLAPASCQTLTPLSTHWPARVGVDDQTTPDALHLDGLCLVVDVSRTPLRAARSIAEAAGVPIIARTAPPMSSLADGSAIAHGTAVGRAVALSRQTGALSPADQPR